MTRATRFVVLSVGCWMAASAEALSCPVCFQIEPGPVSAGVQAAVWVLVVITSGVLSGFAMFAARIVRRSRLQEEPAVEDGRP